MALLFLGLAVGLLWINLLGVGLAAWRLIGDYAVARIAGILTACLAAFFIEHFFGWGPAPPLLPFTTAISVWLIWRHRDVIHRHRGLEAVFILGFCYCLLWRYTFPNIDAESERMPNLAFIDGYMKGETLPAPDRWLSPYRANFYYSFQHYAAGLLGRILGVGPGVAYHLAYCTLAGLIAAAIGGTVTRLCPSRWTRWVPAAALLVGGSGTIVAVRLLLNGEFFYSGSVRFLGGAMVHGNLNAWGTWISQAMRTPGIDPRDLPMEPLSYVLVHGDYHPPLAGHLLLVLACLLIATLETDDGTRRRRLLHALLAATVPLALVANTWIFPLQAMLVGGWFVYRTLRRERTWFWPAALGAATVAFLIFPYLRDFAQATSAKYASIRPVETEDRTPWLGWLLTFWPVVGLLVLSFWNRERRPFVLYLTVVWTLVLAFTEFFYNDDLYGGVWSRFNTTMKWWPWAYAGIVLTVGSVNLGARSRVCRIGTLVLLLPTCIFAFDLGRQFLKNPKTFAGNLTGAGWIQKDPVIADLIATLAALPDGVTLESGLEMANTPAPAITLFARKQSLLGWPWHETTWRGPYSEIRGRLAELNDVYSGKNEDPLPWLLKHNVRYVIWVVRDNAFGNARFAPFRERIRSSYTWHRVGGDDTTLSVGFFERVPAP